MGCDIHGHIEIKVKGKWEHYSVLNTKRDYKLFARMANVRNWRNSGVEPIALAKGLPKKLSLITRIDYKQWKCDAHSVSWLTVEELHIIDKEQGRERNDVNDGVPFGYLFDSYVGGLREYPKNYPKEIEDVRLIFWFDN